jgi:hypothetical protein
VIHLRKYSDSVARVILVDVTMMMMMVVVVVVITLNNILMSVS